MLLILPRRPQLPTQQPALLFPSTEIKHAQRRALSSNLNPPLSPFRFALSSNPKSSFNPKSPPPLLTPFKNPKPPVVGLAWIHVGVWLDDEVFDLERKDKDDGLDECALMVKYVVRRLVRGVSSSREFARQGVAL
ncbi:hypothetical protein Droror1_Dr00022298, partial [Drosera rotundifolia]